MSPTPLRSRRLWTRSAFAVTAAAALLLAGCSGGGGSAEGNAGSGGDSDAKASVDPTAPEQSKASIVGIRGPGMAPVWVIGQEGVDTDYNIEIRPGWVDNSGVAVTSVVSGDAAAANSSYFGVIDAVNQGIDLVVVAEGWASSPGSASLETLPDSGITKIEDLIGKNVAVVSLNSSHAIKLKDQLLKAGLNPDDVNWVELPYGQVPAALEQRTVDASSAVGAVLAQVKNTLKSVTVFDYGGGEYEGMAESGYIMLRSFVEANPNTTAAIQCSVSKASKMVKDDRAFYDQFLTKEMGMAPEDASKINLEDFQHTIRPKALQQNADVALNVGTIDKPFDFASITIPMPDNC